ncbi:MAG: glycosyltransferase [Candidatus Omnitrophota bacterium]
MDKKSLINYFDLLAKGRRGWKARNKYYYRQLEKYLRFLIPEGSSVIEIGCGTGEILAALKPSRGVGLDFSAEMIKIAKDKFPGLEFRVEDAHDLKIEEKFDYVILSDLIGSLLDVQEALGQLKKICAPQTRIIITYYNYLWEPILRLAENLKLKTPQPLQNWLSIYDIENLLSLSGFEVIKKGYKLIFPKYIPLVSSFLNRVIGNLPLINRLSLTEIVIARLNSSSYKTDAGNYTCSIVIPCRNEKGNIRAAIERTPDLGKHTELIFIEGHSKDGTLEEVKKQIKEFPGRDIKVFIQDGIGKGDAVKKGFFQATGDILMILDADLTTPPEDLPKFYRALAEGKGELIIGSRLVYSVGEGAMRFLNLLGNKFFSSLFSYLLEQRIKDTLCGTKVLFRRDYRKIEKNREFFGDFDPFGDFDLIFGAAKQNLKIIEIPIRYMARTYGSTQISRFRHGLLLLKMSGIALKKLKMV